MCIVQSSLTRFFCLSPGRGGIDVDLQMLEEVGAGHLLEIAREHALQAVLFAVLRDANLLSHLPPDAQDELQADYADNLAVCDRRLEELRGLDVALRAQGVCWRLLKAYAYDDTFPARGCVRQGDLDILIRSRDLSAATDVLERLGYARVPRPWEDEYRYKQPGRTTVDLHVSYNAHLEAWADCDGGAEQAMASVKYLPIADWQLPVLQPLDNAFFLLLHMALHHNFVPFSKIVACWNSLVRGGQEIERTALAAAFRRAGLGGVARLALHYMEGVVGTRLAPFGGPDWSASWWEKRAFGVLMPAPAAYFQPASQKRLKRRCRNGLQLCLYPDGWRRTASCLRQRLHARRRGTG